MEAGMSVEFTLNGAPKRIDVAEGESLLDALRERCDVVSTKDGCQPQGQCGCCLVLVDGQPKTSCAMSADKAHGKSIVTLEGVSAEERDMTARAFGARQRIFLMSLRMEEHGKILADRLIAQFKHFFGCGAHDHPVPLGDR